MPGIVGLLKRNIRLLDVAYQTARQAMFAAPDPAGAAYYAATAMVLHQLRGIATYGRQPARLSAYREAVYQHGRERRAAKAALARQEAGRAAA